MTRIQFNVDLVAVIRQAISQVWGSDEREILQDWLDRNTEEAQRVTVYVDIEILPTPSDAIFCEACETWIKRSDLIYWSEDDQEHYLCPHCDTDLLPPQSLEDETDDDWEE